MLLNKIIITSDTCQCKKPYNAQVQKNYPVLPISSVIGIIKVLFGNDVDNFKFGYKHIYENSYKEIFALNKHNRTIGKKVISEPCYRDIYNNNTLILYTDISLDKLSVNHCLTMGRANNLATIKFPIEEIDLIKREGIARNQYSPIYMGNGIVQNMSVVNKFNKILNLFDLKPIKLRFNEELKYNNFFDRELNENIIMWKFNNEELTLVK